jgi:hypothetical protein
MEAAAEFQRQLAQALSTMQDDLGRLRERRAQLHKELANLIAAVAATGHTQASRKRLQSASGS